MMENYLLLLCLFVIAFLYSSVGHGGASGYTAVLALFCISFTAIKTHILILNICVSAIAFFQYYQQKHFNWRHFWPFIISSIPAVVLSALWKLDAKTINLFLGIALIIAAIILFFFNANSEEKTKENPIFFSVLIGAVLGIVSGLLGIGGGIFLSPILVLLHWGKTKTIAASSSLFIIINSIFGLLIDFNTPTIHVDYIIVCIIGGIFGAYYGSKKFSPKIIKKVLAIVIGIAAMKLIFNLKCFTEYFA